ncbi:MAG TPA: tetratricopeptide repeat protein [Pyrinomonadaceae bacterium]|jgi:predicted Zn-dependent protease|nr:tetratricopeptide repeat protein [Pyrinomonadaceae bacterium]
MSTSRIDIFKQMLASDPVNSSILFGLAKEYEKSGQTEEMIETLERYIAISDDEGNAFGMLARAYEKAGQRDKAKEAYQRGIDAAAKHGHPSMSEEYRMALAEF